ncbi:hypothetical protein PRIPAC_80440 [Pristionchus pacificus]|uniref:Uncharacterized protein n=1 Tax=Pristionchus pacificus TaxID=54126 RepID=A0A2A6CQV3_PRIPA|nr:hypothetical protein PRIPAC_80440 [Pristionchus pacificus]|eukprot:PDM80437.1 hypothetical protein PRIPAC_33016 [Pristionchus pacificus]
MNMPIVISTLENPEPPLRNVLQQVLLREILTRSGASGFAALAPQLNLTPVPDDNEIPAAPVLPEVRLARMARTSARGFGRRR